MVRGAGGCRPWRWHHRLAHLADGLVLLRLLRLLHAAAGVNLVDDVVRAAPFIVVVAAGGRRGALVTLLRLRVQRARPHWGQRGCGARGAPSRLAVRHGGLRGAAEKNG